MPTGWSSLGLSFASPNTINAEDLREEIELLQRGINGGYLRSDVINNTRFSFGAGEDDFALSTDKIKKPEFYGSPSPRIEAVTSDTYYKKRTNNKLDRYYVHEVIGTSKNFKDSSVIGAYQPIEGMSCTVFCREEPKFALVTGCCHIFESGGFAGKTFNTITDDGSQDFRGATFQHQSSRSGFLKAQAQAMYVAEMQMFLDKMDGNGPQIIVGAGRTVKARGRGAYNCRRRQIAFTVPLVTGGTLATGLTIGVNKVSYRIRYRLFDDAETRYRHIYVDARNFVVDVYYK